MTEEQMREAQNEDGALIDHAAQKNHETPGARKQRLKGLRKLRPLTYARLVQMGEIQQDEEQD